MTGTMRAQRLDTATKKMTVESIPIPEPGRGEVLVKVAFCGICHSDLSLINGTFAPRTATITQGHEASGTVAAIGPDVTGWKIGDRVIAAAARPDFTCIECQRGNLAGCLNLKLMAFDYDGGWAEYTIAQARMLTRVPDNVPLEQAAILADAVSTPYGAVVNSADVRVGEAVGIWGLGGLGTHIVQISRLVGAVPIVALDISAETRERALELGADFAFDSADKDVPEKIKSVTNGRGLDVAFDAVGIPATFAQAAASLGPNGRLVVVGMSNSEVCIGTSQHFVRSRIEILAHLGYQNEDIGTLAQLVSRGRLDVSHSISAIIPLEQIEEGIHQLESRQGNPIRILVQPSGA
jgi:D-arabinose 1-dehydrogenase-like Zn-dependent alcohol dehydrogenase